MNNFVSELQSYFASKYPFLSANIPRQQQLLGDSWSQEFDGELIKHFGTIEELRTAADGYAKFAMDSLLLTAKFQKTKDYDNKTYAECASEVYQSESYMHSLYLPGILLSHYLWKHHYAMYQFYKSIVVPVLPKSGLFIDVGVGTGFYSRNLLRDSQMTGIGCDMSPHSLSYTRSTLSKFGTVDKYSFCLCDYYHFNQYFQSTADFILSIEVLEHLEDPMKMLESLYKSLKPGGLGLISAAVNAPNADHIYLYRSCEDVRHQLIKAGFEIRHDTCDEAYEARTIGEVVPVNYGALVCKPS
ncbi:class I SAM-dependent methyltransferase [Parasynechococcus marenigrum]|uniref:Methyltransferase domain-containing protein n=1 Tax=Parasynechococcus marenigrum (strain WH8102) TaxID=84588 RepID=Q7U920_PARMW|nr:class I SAM-dependent methyltransferase [Parasynechococcus marenigrum]CAE06954.1 conserved hypothetical protein [Parasynechococcus marenigrum WH 8102]